MKSFIIAGFVMISVLASTRIGSAQNIGGGVKIGANVSTVSGDIDAEKGVRTGPVVGGFVTVPRSGMLAFQPEVLYSMQGVKATAGDGTKLTLEIDEIQIPLLLRLGRNGTVAVHFLVGPSIGIITKAKAKAHNFESDFKGELKSTDIGLLIGTGVTVNRFLMEARYTVGMTNLNDDDSDDNKSRVFSVLVGVGF